MDLTVSVIVATRNRINSLRRCLESLRTCTIPLGWNAEIVVVDNGCSKDVKELVDSLTLKGTSVQFRYLCEKRRGKGFAVNHGAAAAKGSIFAFTDDDIIVDREWVCEILDAFRSDSSLALIAGRVDPVDSGGQLVAVTRAVERIPLNDLVSLEGLVLGCNLAIRPEVLEKVIGRDTRLGPGRGLSCEDIDFTYRVLRSGFCGVHLPGPTVYHEPGERDRRREYLRGWGAFYIKFLLAGDRKVTRQAWWRLCAIGKEFAAGKCYSALNQAWHLAAGACIMATRMALSKRPYG